MALIRCPECNKDVSNTAETCPHCGFRITPKAKSWVRSAVETVGLLIAAFVGIAVIIAVFDPFEQSNRSVTFVKADWISRTKYEVTVKNSDSDKAKALIWISDGDYKTCPVMVTVRAKRTETLMIECKDAANVSNRARIWVGGRVNLDKRLAAKMDNKQQRGEVYGFR